MGDHRGLQRSRTRKTVCQAERANPSDKLNLQNVESAGRAPSVLWITRRSLGLVHLLQTEHCNNGKAEGKQTTVTNSKPPSRVQGEPPTLPSATPAPWHRHPPPCRRLGARLRYCFRHRTRLPRYPRCCDYPRRHPCACGGLSKAVQSVVKGGTSWFRLIPSASPHARRIGCACGAAKRSQETPVWL